MRSNDGACTLAIDVEIADVEFAFCHSDLLARAGIDRAGESKLGVIGDLEAVFEISRFDHRQHWTEDFFLLKLGLRLNVCDHRWLDKVAFAGVGSPLASGNQPAFSLADLSVVEN